MYSGRDTALVRRVAMYIRYERYVVCGTLYIIIRDFAPVVTHVLFREVVNDEHVINDALRGLVLDSAPVVTMSYISKIRGARFCSIRLAVHSAMRWAPRSSETTLR